jgi:hypothetical protein
MVVALAEGKEEFGEVLEEGFLFDGRGGEGSFGAVPAESRALAARYDEGGDFSLREKFFAAGAGFFVMGDFGGIGRLVFELGSGFDVG